MTDEEREQKIRNLEAFANEYLDRAVKARWGRGDYERIAYAALREIAKLKAEA